MTKDDTSNKQCTLNECFVCWLNKYTRCGHDRRGMVDGQGAILSYTTMGRNDAVVCQGEGLGIMRDGMTTR